MGDVMLGPDVQQLYEHFSEVVATGRPAEFEYALPDRGGRRWLRITAAKFADGLVVTASDMMQLRQWEERLYAAQKSGLSGEFAKLLVHDFGNVLTAIQGVCEVTLSEMDPDDRWRQDFEDIVRVARDASELTVELQALGQQHQAAPEQLMLNDVIEEIERLICRVLPDEIDVRSVLAPDLWEVTARPSLLKQVLLNLVLNAKEAMPAGGQLTIETSNVLRSEEHGLGGAGFYVMCSVSDTGCGMSKEVQAHIFEPLFTLKKAGSGLGLYSVQGLVKRSRGFIEVESEQGAGSTFRVFLPRSM